MTFSLCYFKQVTDIHVLRVFTDENGDFGDTVTIVYDEGREIPDDARKEIAKLLDAVETVFVNDANAHQVSFVHSQGEIDFAGVPALGIAWLFGERESEPVSRIEGRGGDIAVSSDNGLTWVRASLATMPPWKLIQLANANAIDQIILAETIGWEHTMVWAWIDETRGVIRARTFASDWDIPEAQGNGSGAMLLAAELARPVEIRHGEGSVIYARPASDDSADIGGRVCEGSMLKI